MVPKFMFFALLLACSPIVQAADLSALPTDMAASPSSKITFDVSSISSEGLMGSNRDLRSVDYEFCIPATTEHLAEVRAIDPSIRYYEHSRGRIGCSSNQYLCIGNTHQPQWREILLNIANLDYVDRIDQVFWE